MVHIQAVETRSPPHLCGWILLHSLQDYVSLPVLPDTTLLLQRIAVMPKSRVKTLLFEEALSTWTRYAPHQELVTFATQVRIFALAHMDSWTSSHALHFGGMFPTPTPPSVQVSWNVVSPATKSKLLQKIRSHVPRPFVCPCVQRLTAYVEIDRRIASDVHCIYQAFPFTVGITLLPRERSSWSMFTHSSYGNHTSSAIAVRKSHP